MRHCILVPPRKSGRGERRGLLVSLDGDFGFENDDRGRRWEKDNRGSYGGAFGCRRSRSNRKAQWWRRVWSRRGGPRWGLRILGKQRNFQKKRCNNNSLWRSCLGASHVGRATRG